MRSCRILSPDLHAEGIVVAPATASGLPQGFRSIVAGHPVPDKESFAAGQAILNLLAAANQHTLVFFLLSGGGSALVELPLDAGVTLEDMQAMNRALVTCGASIDEVNAVRKHLSAVKGGRLAVAAGAAMKITLGVTDVPEGQSPRSHPALRFPIRPRFRTPAAWSAATICSRSCRRALELVSTIPKPFRKPRRRESPCLTRAGPRFKSCSGATICSTPRITLPNPQSSLPFATIRRITGR